MSSLALNTVELTSTLRTAPLNGAPSSSDYNSSQRENLVDLASIVDFINNQILPLVNALPATALQPLQDPIGIEGRSIWADTSDQGILFFDSLSSNPLTVADSLRVLNGVLTTMGQQLVDLGIEVASLQARLASTNQNDIALALQNLSSSLNQLTVAQQIQATQISQISSAKIVTKRSGSTSVPAGTTITIPLVFTAAFNDNLYTVSIGLETSSANGLVSAGSFQRDGGGTGVTVGIVNNDAIDHTVIVNVTASHD